MSRKDREFYKAEFEEAYCDNETDKALHIHFSDGKTSWIPKSLVEDDSEVYKQGDKGTLVLPEWFAVKEGLV